MADKFDDLLSPLARLMVARDVPFAAFGERLKGHYVRAARALTDKKPTDSLLSLMTGLSRREVARLRSFEGKPAKPNHLTRLVALWRTDPDYSRNGTPKVLPRTGGAGSFEGLARKVLQDVHPHSLLLMLEQAGTVAVDGDRVRLLQEAYLPRTGSDEQLAYLVANVGDHLRAATANVTGQPDRMFERALHVSGLTAAQVETLHAGYAEAQMTLLQDLQRQAEQMKSETGGTGTCRFRAGGYVYMTREKTDDPS